MSKNNILKKVEKTGSGKYSRKTDEQLLDLSRNRDYEAFEELVRRYEGRIYRLGMKILRSPEDAEDVLQKTFLSVFENMAGFRGDSRVSTWIFRIASNHALMKLRKDRGKTFESLDKPFDTGNGSFIIRLADGDGDLHTDYEKKEFFRFLEKAVAELPDIYRLVFILRDVEGFSNKEVSLMLNLSVPAIKSRVLRARIFIREKLEEFRKGVDKNG